MRRQFLKVVFIKYHLGLYTLSYINSWEHRPAEPIDCYFVQRLAIQQKLDHGQVRLLYRHADRVSISYRYRPHECCPVICRHFIVFWDQGQK